MKTVYNCPNCSGKIKINIEKAMGIPSGDSGYYANATCAKCGKSFKNWALKKNWVYSSLIRKINNASGN